MKIQNVLIFVVGPFFKALKERITVINKNVLLKLWFRCVERLECLVAFSSPQLQPDMMMMS